MEHPPKQGLKRNLTSFNSPSDTGFNGTSTKTRIETCDTPYPARVVSVVLMEHPPKQGLKPFCLLIFSFKLFVVLMEHPPKQGLKLVIQPKQFSKIIVF